MIKLVVAKVEDVLFARFIGQPVLAVGNYQPE